MTNMLIESTSETAEIAAEPTLLTIMVSTVPIRDERSCSMMIGISSLRRSTLLYMWAMDSAFFVDFVIDLFLVIIPSD